MGRPKNNGFYMSNQDRVFYSFVNKAIRELKKTGCTIVFNLDHINEIKKEFGEDELKILPLCNYYKVIVK